MSLSWTFLTKSFLPLKYRDTFAVMLIGKFGYNKYVNYINEGDTHDAIMSRVYTHDESDIEFRETYNMVDSAVRRDKTITFANRVKAQRAMREREL